MLTSQQRYQSIQGLMMGLAIGDALASPRVGRSPHTALRVLGRRRLRYRMWPRCGLYSDDTQFALMAGQAILQSRSTSEQFHKYFRRRLRWYVLSLPPGLSISTFFAGLKCWLSWTGLKAGRWSAGNSPTTRSMLLGVVLHNTGHRYQVWARDSAGITHTHALVGDAAAVLATAGQIAAVTSGGRLNKEAALETLIKAAKEEKLREALKELKPFLIRRSTPRKVARHFKWSHGINKHIMPTTVMAIYCFLRFPASFERAVKSALLLAGNNDALVATVGGLVGAHVGVEKLPHYLHDQLGDWPHSRTWIERLATRLSDWPHGVDDLLMAPGLPSYPVAQLLRNLTRWPLVIAHRVRLLLRA
ncbi:MAG: ADP-ribosylglycohydrolase family protein [Pirellulaceae bacterium]|nr:ADP-ribosylglycohydrolase family protein [Pirellulaceae bacterium]